MWTIWRRVSSCNVVAESNPDIERVTQKYNKYSQTNKKKRKIIILNAETKGAPPTNAKWEETNASELQISVSAEMKQKYNQLKSHCVVVEGAVAGLKHSRDA